MLKKFMISAAMLLVLGLGASQLVAKEKDNATQPNNIRECEGSEFQCCPSTNQGAALSGCLKKTSGVTCIYTNYTVLNLYCP